MSDKALGTLLRRLTEARGTFDWNSTQGLATAARAVNSAFSEFWQGLYVASRIYQAADEDTPGRPFQVSRGQDLTKWLEELKQSCIEYLKECGLGCLYNDRLGLLAHAEHVMEITEGDELTDPAIAAETLHALIELQECRAENLGDEAIRKAILIGELLNQSDFLEQYQAGMRAIEAGRKASEATWGTEKERLKKKAVLLRMFKEERPKCRSNEAAYQAVAKRAGVEKRTVRRAVTGH
jgi:hypothetical protein